jgi:hypothetical protein
MRRLLLAQLLAFAPVAVMAADLGVPLNHSIMVTLAAPAHNVFLGSPDIADVAMSDQRHIVVTGKKAGVTNLMVTDIRGRRIYDREVVVTVHGGDQVALINGPNVVTYACAPTCEQNGAAQGVPGGTSPATTTSTSNSTWTMTYAAPGSSSQSESTSTYSSQH